MMLDLALIEAMEFTKTAFVLSFLFRAFALPTPFPLFLLTFAVSAAVQKTAGAKSIRNLWYYLIHAAAFALTAGLYLTLGGRGSGAATLDLASPSLYVPLLSAGATWLRASWIAKNSGTHPFAVARFDEGIAAFGFALMILALVRLPSGEETKLILPFFAFGILALGSAKRRDTKRGGLAPRRGGGGFFVTAGIFVAAALAAAPLVPLLFEPAKTLSLALGNGSLALLRFIVRILTELFKGGNAPPSFGYREREGPMMLERAGEEQTTSSILMWVFIGIFSLFALALLGYLLYVLALHLRSRRGGSGAAKKGGEPFLRRLLRWLADSLRKAVAILRRPRASLSRAQRAYAAMLARGRLFGRPRRSCETPMEYAARLAAAFPAAATGAAALTGLVEKEVYGRVALNESERREVLRLAKGFTRLAFARDLASRVSAEKSSAKPAS